MRMGIDMDTEQERAAFEDCFKSLGVGPYQPHNNMYVADEIQARWEAWQARAALQSQDLEDALRYRFLKARQDIDDEELEFTVVVNAHFDLFQSSQELEEAIDHARCVEVEGE